MIQKETDNFEFDNSPEMFTGEDNNNMQVVPDFQISLNRAKIRTNMMEQFVSEMMKEGIDYGVFPGYPKPSLFKSGAEKLSDIFGFSKRIEVLNRLEDWNTGLFHYEIKVVLVNKRNGLIEAEGLGSCNTKEKKFKNNDPYTIVNAVLKIAKKRAVVDAVLSATRSSGFFTQDVEDLGGSEAYKNLDGEGKASEITRTEDKNDEVSDKKQKATADKGVSKKQLYLIYELASKKGISNEEAKSILKERFDISESTELTAKQASDFISYLQGLDKQ